MQFVVVFDHAVNQEELEAHGQDRTAWESMFLDYLQQTSLMDPVVTTIASVNVQGELPTEPAQGLTY